MKVAIFFDGKNFLKALEHYDRRLEVNYDSLAKWIVKGVGGPDATFVGAYYYTGLSIRRGATSPLADFLSRLEHRRGYFVRREPRVRRSTRCHHCGVGKNYLTEKRVDARLVADLIHLAAVDAYDIAVLLSGDQDFVPGVEAVMGLGKHVVVGTWGGSGLSQELRRSCFDELRLEHGREIFASGRSRPSGGRQATLPAEMPLSISQTSFAVAGVPTRTADGAIETDVQPIPDAHDSSIITAAARDTLLRALSAAHLHFTRFNGGHLSRWYFCNKWQVPGDTTAAADREHVIASLLADGEAEEYVSSNSKGRVVACIRPTPKHGVPPDGDLATPTDRAALPPA